MKKSRKNENEITYWESMADGVIGLLLCVLLILLLLILYLIHITDEENNGYEQSGIHEGTTHEYSYEYADPDEGAGGGGEWDDDDDENGGGGGGYPYEDPDPGKGEGDGSDKAAVFVQIVDGETQKIIKKRGVQFELYDTASILQVLSTYYPIKTDYKKYETNDEGVFYLPEKIRIGTYYLHDLTQIEGYDKVENWEVSPDQEYDWDEPYLVSVEFFPSKNIIRLQLKDIESGEPLTGASFEIIAAENITTKDGTVRYKQGAVADTIEVDENGYAESKELYLGKYTIRQSGVPEYYGRINENKTVQVKSKTAEATPPLNELKEQKTAIQIKVTDALYENSAIANAVFRVTTGSGEIVANLTTDENGSAELTNLKKGISYHIKQTASAKNYKIDTEDHVFTVSDSGYVNDRVTEELTVANSIIRAAFSVKDKIFGGQVSDINLALFDNSGKVIQRWNTSAVDNIIEGLEPGDYRIVMNGDESNAYPITIEDKVEVQTFTIDQWTRIDIAFIAAVIIVGAGVLALAAFIIRRRGRNAISEE